MEWCTADTRTAATARVGDRVALVGRILCRSLVVVGVVCLAAADGVFGIGHMKTAEPLLDVKTHIPGALGRLCIAMAVSAHGAFNEFGGHAKQ